MPATIKIPVMLRQIFGGLAEVQAGGETVGQVVSHLAGQFPGLEERLNTLIILVDDQDIRTLQGLDTPISPESEIKILPFLSGG